MIWVDVDDVIADFTSYMEERIGIQPDAFGWDVGGLFCERYHIAWNEFAPLPWARDLIAVVRRCGEYAYLTACCDPMRVLWLNWFDPGCRIVMTINKEVVVRVGDILIDDRDVVCDGTLIRVPAKWWSHRPEADEVIKIVREELW